MVDREVLAEKTKLLAEYINDLKEYAGIKLNELKGFPTFISCFWA